MVRTYTHNLKTTGLCGRSVYRTTALLYEKHSLCGLQLHERHMYASRLFSDTTLSCIIILQAHAYIAVYCATAHDIKLT